MHHKTNIFFTGKPRSMSSSFTLHTTCSQKCGRFAVHTVSLQACKKSGLFFFFSTGGFFLRAKEHKIAI